MMSMVLRSRLGRLLLVTGALAGLTAGRAAGQEVSLAARGPRFLVAASEHAAPVEVDARSSALLRQRVSLDARRGTLGGVLQAISEQTGIKFLYNPDSVPVGRVVSLRADSITVAGALLEMLIDANLDVLLSSGKQVALVRRERLAARVGSGAIVGRVTDAKTESGVVGATVVVAGTRHSATTGNDGRYRIGEVAPGTYTVRARYIGYAPATASVSVNVDQEATADFALEKSAQQLNEVVTTGTIVPTEVKALPTPVTVISASDIALQRPHTVQELFRQAVPTAVSWDLADAPESMTFSVRGASTLNTGGAQMKLFIDGIEAASADVTAIDPNSIERMEVIRGPQAAAIYGSDAIGGVIQVFTKRGDPSLTRPHVDAQAALGMIQTPYAGYTSVARQTYTASVYGGGSDVGYNLGAGYSRTPDYVQPGTAQSNPSVHGGMRFARGIMSLDVSGRYAIVNSPLAFNPALAQTGSPSFSQPYYQSYQNQNQTLGARIELVPIAWWQHTVTVGLDHSSQDLAQTQPRLTTPDDTLLSVFNTGATKASIGYTTSVRGTMGGALFGSLTAGVDHYSLRQAGWFAFTAPSTTGDISSDATNPIFVERTITNNTGYFAQAQVSFRDALFLTGGLRAEQNTNLGDSLGTPVSPRVGLSAVQAVGGTTLKVRGSWGRAIRAPSPGLKGASAQPGFVQLANPQLAPQRQHGWDAGVDAVFGQHATLGVTYYDQTADNLIAIVQAQIVPTLAFQYQNIGRVRNTGVEVEASLSVGPVQAKAQYGYARARIEHIAPGSSDFRVGDQVLATPRHTAGGSVTVSALKGTTVVAGVTYVGSWTNVDFLAEFRCFGGTGPCQSTTRDYFATFPGFVKANATVWQRLTGAVSAFVSVDNLANQTANEYNNVAPVFGRITTIGFRLAY